MEIKPIKRIAKIASIEIPTIQGNKNMPRAHMPLEPPSGKWSFQHRQIILNGKNIAVVIQEAAGEGAAFWFKLGNDLDRYRNQVLQKNARRKKKKVGDKIVEEWELDEELSLFSATVDAYLGKILRLVQKRYDQTTDGLSYSLDADGQLILNGMNVTQFLEMAKKYPGDKARIFLKGLKNRLGVLAANKRGSANYEKIWAVTVKVCREIDAMLQKL